MVEDICTYIYILRKAVICNYVKKSLERAGAMISKELLVGSSLGG